MRLANILTLLNGLIFPVIFVFLFSIIWKENGIWFAFVVSEIATLLVIYLHSAYLNKKTPGEYSGFFLKNVMMKTRRCLNILFMPMNMMQYIYLNRFVTF